MTDEVFFGNHSSPTVEQLRLCHLTAERAGHRLPPVLLTEKASGVKDAFEMIPWKALLATYPRSGSDMLTRALINLSRLALKPGTSITLHDYLWPRLFADSADEAVYMTRALADLRHIAFISNWDSNGCVFQITPRGWDFIHQSNTDPKRSRQAFVAMWFSDVMTPIWADAIRPAVAACDFDPLRIDLKEHNNKICDEIIAEIRRSRFVIADFSGNRGGVYFEAGFAMGLGLPVIWTVRDEDMGNVHFDTNHYSHITYKSPEELRVKLTNRIKATIT